MGYFNKIRVAAGFWLIWFILFGVARWAFILFNHPLSPQTSYSELLLASWHGSKMDVATSSYLLAPFCILLLLACFFRPFQSLQPYQLYTRILLIPVILITISDLPAYTTWGFRLDSTVLKYLKHPKEAWASIGHLPLGYLLLSMALTYWLLYRFFSFYFKKIQPLLNTETKTNWIEFILLITFTAAQIIPIRGGFQLAPLNQSSVYFSKDNFANVCALNATWNFMRSISAQGNVDNNPFEYLGQEELEKQWTDLQRAETDSLLKSYSSVTHPNVILITWESLTSKALNQSIGGVKVLPCLERRIQDGIYFENAFASGDRTDKGMVAILSGYPAQPITSILKMPEKTRSLPCLPRFLKNSGYHTSFYYGGETEFANMKSYLLGAGFDQITDVNAFDRKDRNSKWGAHDHVAKNRIIQDINNYGQPFFLHWLTLSSHEPFETGTQPAIQGSDDVSLFMNSLHYTDSVVDQLIQYCSEQPWWKETIIVISGDHGHRLPNTGNKLDDFRTPVLLLGGALKNAPERISHVVSQTGIAAGICSLTNTKADFPFAVNILTVPETPYAYFCFNNGFGYTQLGNYFIYDNVGRMIMEQGGKVDSTMIRRGMAFQQKSFADYLGR